jgi:hypothetical protein
MKGNLKAINGTAKGGLNMILVIYMKESGKTVRGMEKVSIHLRMVLCMEEYLKRIVYICYWKEIKSAVYFLFHFFFDGNFDILMLLSFTSTFKFFKGFLYRSYFLVSHVIMKETQVLLVFTILIKENEKKKNGEFFQSLVVANHQTHPRHFKPRTRSPYNPQHCFVSALSSPS